MPAIWTPSCDLKKILDTLNGVEATGKADSGEKALRMIDELSSHLVLLDLALPGMDGFTVLEQARKRRADGFLLKDSAADDIIAWLQGIRSGEQHHSKQTKPNTSPVLPPPLSIRQISHRTVQNHRASIYSKPGLRGPNQLLRFLRSHMAKM